MIILVDMDNVITDFDKGFLDKYRAQFPDAFYVPIEERKSFEVEDDYPKELHEKVKSIYLAPHFFLDLPPIEGGIEALKKMRERGDDVIICTAPMRAYEHCILEKYQWVETHLGREWTERINLGRDKTIVRGHILIDDKPEIKGLGKEYTDLGGGWEHVLFDAPHNRHIPSPMFKKEVGMVPGLPARINWSNWEEFRNTWYSETDYG